jgi:hypothetical protein
MTFTQNRKKPGHTIQNSIQCTRIEMNYPRQGFESHNSVLWTSSRDHFGNRFRLRWISEGLLWQLDRRITWISFCGLFAVRNPRPPTATAWEENRRCNQSLRSDRWSSRFSAFEIVRNRCRNGKYRFQISKKCEEMWTSFDWPRIIFARGSFATRYREIRNSWNTKGQKTA